MSGKSVTEAERRVHEALRELRTMVNNTSSWNAAGFRRVWSSKIDAAHQAASDLRKACAEIAYGATGWGSANRHIGDAIMHDDEKGGDA